jgi:NAD(P)-dependent dehydrogenase (short-subunit alcohol dehydrogenase family)
MEPFHPYSERASPNSTRSAESASDEQRRLEVGNRHHVERRRGDRPPLHCLYSATMSAYDGMVYALATELGPQGIRVNLVRPGVVATERVASPPMTRR